MPKRVKDIFLRTFQNLNDYQIIWKWEDSEKMPDKPDNVLIRKWLPQQDILGHPDTKLFITHGGLMSTLEALYKGVPTLALPVFLDQFTNAERGQRLGYGETISWKNFTEIGFR